MQAEARPAASDRAPDGAADASRSIVAGAVVGGRYCLRQRLHRGANTEVWRAHDASGGGVAVKLALGSAAAVRLRAEHALLARLEHAAILRPVAWDGANAALVTEYLAGGDLVSLAGDAPRHWAAGALDVLGALAYLHARDIVHRDVKARNVMFTAQGRARLIDFGSAAPAGAERRAAGTTAAHRYASTGTIACSDDIHAFAVLAHELLTGRLPGEGGARAAAARPAAAGGGAAGPRAALEALVSRTLAARDPRGIGSIRAYRDVIESMLAA